MRGSLVSWETIVLINPWFNNFGNLQSCRNTSWWISVERTCLYWTPLSPGRHQSQPQDRIGWRQALCLQGTWSLSLLNQRSEQPSEEEHWVFVWLAILKGEMGQWLWMGLLVPQMQAYTCCQGTDTRRWTMMQWWKPSHIVCMDLELVFLQL